MIQALLSGIALLILIPLWIGFSLITAGLEWLVNYLDPISMDEYRR